MATERHVYRIGHQPAILTVLYTGTQAQCESFIHKRKVKGEPTHGLVISCLELEAAAKAFL